MFRCPVCGASTRTRSSFHVTKNTQRTYHQCNNVLCSASFSTLTEVTHYLTISKPNLSDLPPMPPTGFPKSHQGSNQIEMHV